MNVLDPLLTEWIASNHMDPPYDYIFAMNEYLWLR
jgi:hypothetical protein